MHRPASYANSGVLPSTDNGTSGAYAYDGAGNVTAIGANAYLYDAVSRLTSASQYTGPAAGTGAPPATQTAAYDALGNLTSLTTNGALLTTATSTSTNRFNTAGYAAGSMTSWNGNAYGYEPLGMTRQVVASGVEYDHVYTADDERLWTYSPGNPSRFTVRDLDGKVLREFKWDNVTWVVERDYVHRDGVLLATVLPTGAVNHFHPDHLGSPRLITGAGGAYVAYHLYHPYGAEATAFNQDAERMKFTGHERDLGLLTSPADDIDYMHARYYGPLMGRLLSVDPIIGGAQQPQGWNRYSYVINNPLKYIDPTGMAEVCTGADDSRACVLVDGDGDGDTSDDDLSKRQIRILAKAYGDFIAANDGADLGDKGTNVSGGSQADRSLIRAASQFVGANLPNGWRDIEIRLVNLGSGEAGRMDHLRNSRYPNGVYLLNINPGEAGHGSNPSSVARTLTHEYLHRDRMDIRFQTREHRALDDRAKAYIKKWGLAGMGCPALGGPTWFGLGPQFYSGC